MSGITKCDKLLLQSASGIGKCGSYYKVHQLLQSVTDCYYKVHLVLQSVAIITKWDVTHVMLSEKEIWIGQKKNKKVMQTFSSESNEISLVLVKLYKLYNLYK